MSNPASYSVHAGQIEIWHVPYNVIQLGPSRFRLECPWLAEKLEVPDRYAGYKYYLPTMNGVVYVDSDGRGVVFEGVESVDELIDVLFDYLPAIESVGYEALQREK